VLVDSTPAVERVWRGWAERHGIQAQRILEVAHGRRTAETIHLVAPHLDADSEAYELERDETENMEGVVGIEGAPELLASLPAGAWTVVTSGSRSLATRRMQHTGLPLPERFVTAEDVENGKPHPEPYLEGARLLGVRPETCVVIEDAPSGVRAAKSAGMYVVAVATTHREADLTEADAVAGSLSEVHLIPRSHVADGAPRFEVRVNDRRHESVSAQELPATERRNPSSSGLDEMSVDGILRLMNDEDRKVTEAVADALPRIAEAVELLVAAWRAGGRWIYVGAGTSGRLAALDAAECPPTFGVPHDRVFALLAGGQGAASRAVEDAEDDREAAIQDLEAIDLGPEDVVVGLAASGRTPYVTGAVEHASRMGCATVGVSNNPSSELCAIARVGIEVVTGPEVLTGSTRLKAGTSQKMVLNMLSTAAFTLLGKVYENLMVDVQATNQKLKKRARRIVREAAVVPEVEAERLLRSAGGSVKVAVVMGKAGVPADAARARLDAADGSVRRALDETMP
jgi:N-acetylmuramic acid 6-phosphate etherase